MATLTWPQVPPYSGSRRGTDRLRWGNPVAASVPGWLWVCGRMVRVCDAALPRGRWLADSQRG